MAKSEVKVATPKVDEELLLKNKKATKKLAKYFEENKLDPTVDYTKSKKHGEAVRALVAVINSTRDKINATAPAEKGKGERTKEKVAKEGEKPKEKKASVLAKYDYPLVNGKEMTSGEKKKYRVKMRAGNKPEKVEKVTDKKAKTLVEAKPEKKSVKVEAPAAEAKKTDKKSDKKKKKHTKED